MDDNEIKHFVEAALLAAGRPLSIDQLQNLFEEGATPEKPQIREAIGRLREEYEARGLTIAEVASGFRTQIKSSMAERLNKLWEERPPRYSRALFETLALIAYRQPMTRGEIEEIRGVAVSTNIIRTLLERDWIRVVGHRDVPGRPAMFGTTKQFLDYFGLKKLDDLPPLADLSDWESLRVQLNLPSVDREEEEAEPESADVTELPVLHIDPEEIADEPRTGGSEDEDPEDTVDMEGIAGDAEPVADEEAPGEAAEVSGFEEIVAREWPDPRVSITITTESPDEEDEPDVSTVGARRAGD